MALPAFFKNHDFRLWLFGELFILAFVGLVFGIGFARGWWEPLDLGTSTRFQPEPKFPFGDRGVKFRDNGFWSQAYWYYWQSKPEDQTWWGSHLLPWLGYVVHNGLVWFFMYKAQLENLKVPKYGKKLNKWNYQLIITNCVMYCLHLLQTHTTYDGTAIDVIITSGLSSVSMMIAFVFILEFHDRGLVFGWPQKHHEDALGWSQLFRKMTAQTSYIMRKYHGYCFVWFNIWTFWYHPLENTFAHATGIFLIWQFLLQSSLIYTDMHLVKPWRFFVEISVVIHGPAVALQMELYQPTPTGQPSLWPMFLYGFAFCFILTSIFTLDTFRTLKWYLRPLPWTVFMVWVFIYYEFVASSGNGNWTDAIDACKIPAILYFTAFCGYFTMEMFHWATKKVRERLNPWIWMFLAFLMVALFTLLSILSYQLEWTKLIDFPKLGNKLWTPTNGVLTGMFLVFLDNHFFAIKKQKKEQNSVEEQEIHEDGNNVN